MKKVILFLIGVPLLLIACNASATPIVDAPAPTEAIPFTPIPTFTSIPPVEQAVLPTSTIPPIQQPPSNGPVPIIFDVNGTYKDVVDSIPAGSSKTYSVNAAKGQIASISAFPQIPDGSWGYIHLQIVGADGTLLCPQALNTDCPFWRGALPSSQNYFLTVTPEGDAVNFTLRVAINPPGKSSQSFHYGNPATGLSLTYSDMFIPAVPPYGNYKTQPELALQLIDSAAYYKTNLGQAFLFISSTNDPQIVATCTEPSQATGELEQVIGNEVINGYTFVHSTGNGAGVGNLYQQEIYRTVNKNICYEVIYYLHSSQVGNFPADAGITEFDRNAVIQKFYGVFSTFSIK
ncbi:MAG: hypothetical protein JNM55_00465 [Anaerolineales bacterium]|nr:hypothetical protein [Anaerolineales bacterium]